jgi:hypothetical protein
MSDRIKDRRSLIQQFSGSKLPQDLRVFEESIVNQRHSADLSVSSFAPRFKLRDKRILILLPILPSFNLE